MDANDKRYDIDHLVNKQKPRAGRFVPGSWHRDGVELRGIEPLSSELASEASPGAAGDLMSGPRRAPARYAFPSPISVPLGTRTLPRG